MIFFLKYIIFLFSIIIPKCNNVIVFGSRDGLLFSDNSRYLFLYCSYFLKKKIIWVTRSSRIFSYLKSKNLTCYYSNSLKGIFYSLICKYQVFSYSEKDISNYFIYFGNKINLWHGFLIKKIFPLTERINIKSNYIHKFKKFFKNYFNKYYLIYPNIKYAKGVINFFDIEKNVSIIESNFCRNIMLLNKTSDLNLFRTSKELKLIHKLDKYKFVIGYFPTYRKNGIDLIFDDHEIESLKKINRILRDHNSIILFRSHLGLKKKFKHKFYNYKNEQKLKILNSFSNFLYLEDDMDLNSVLPSVNLLISDYSGAIIDFLFLNRPIILYTPDLSDYKRDPGFSVDIFKSSFFYNAYCVKNVFNHLKVFLNKPKKFSDFHSNSRKKNINKFIRNKDPFKLIVDRLQN